MKAASITYFIHNFDHFLQFIRADVRAVSEPKVDEDPLAQEVLTLDRLFVLINEREGTAQCRSSYRPVLLFFNHCRVTQLNLKELQLTISLFNTTKTCFRDDTNSPSSSAFHLDLTEYRTFPTKAVLRHELQKMSEKLGPDIFLHMKNDITDLDLCVLIYNWSRKFQENFQTSVHVWK